MAPSSRHLVARLLAPLALARARVVVEYGPGLDAVTGELLRRLRPDARLVAVEANADFAAHLRAELRDPRLAVVHASAEDVGGVLARLGLAAVDGVVSSLPLALMPRAARRRVLRATRAAVLRWNGVSGCRSTATASARASARPARAGSRNTPTTRRHGCGGPSVASARSSVTHCASGFRPGRSVRTNVSTYRVTSRCSMQ